MPGGFRAAEAWVEISTDLDGSQIERAARRAAEDVDSVLTSGMERTGAQMSDTLGRAGESGGDRMSRSLENRLRDARSRFIGAGTKIGDDVSKGTEDSGKRNGIRSFMGWVDGAGRTGTMAGGSFSTGMIRAASPVIVATAPLLGASMAGGIVAGLGVGTIGLGIALALQDPAIAAEAKATGADIGNTLKGAAVPFKAELLAVFADARGAFARWAPELRGLFSDASRLMRPLSTSLINVADRILPSVHRAVANAEAPVNALRMGFEGIGDAIGDSFDTLSEDADEGASALTDLTMAVENLIRTSTGIVHFAAQVKGVGDQMDVAADKGRYWLEESSGFADIFRHYGKQLDLTADGFKAGSVQAEAYKRATLGVGQAADFAVLKTAGMTDAQITQADASGRYRASLDQAAGGLNAVRGAANGAIPGVRSLREILDDLTGEAISSEQANIRLEQAIDDATGAAKRNGKGIDENNPKQRANRQALIGIADAAHGAAAKIYAQTGSQEAANVASERGRKKFLEVANSMGVEKGEAIALANKLFGIPNVKKDVKINDTQAQAALAAIKHGIATVQGKTVTVTVKYETRGSVQGEHTIGVGTNTRRHGGITEYARNGLLREAQTFSATAGPARYAFAEAGTGGEAFVPRLGDPRKSLPVLERAANWYGKSLNGGGGSSTNNFHFGPGAIVLDASKIASVADLVRMVEALTVTARTMRVRGATVGSRA